MRVSTKEVNAVFGFWLKETGQRLAKDYNDIGGLRLDYNSVYGGYEIQKIINKAGGICTPILGRRLSPSEFVTALRFSMDSIKWFKGGN